jgi:hypothetical protein
VYKELESFPNLDLCLFSTIHLAYNYYRISLYITTNSNLLYVIEQDLVRSL